MNHSYIKKVQGFVQNISWDITGFLRWVLLAGLVGLTVGLAGTAFHFCMKAATAFRIQNGWIVWLLPFAGLAIVGLYRICGVKTVRGTDLVLESIRSKESLPLRMAPLIFLTTVMTHLFGGSAGREGAALQLGGSIASRLGRVLHLDIKDMHIITMCGMSAAFAALFGTPLASAVFALEVVSVGVMYYAALVPCVIAALVGSGVALFFHAEPTSFVVQGVPALGALSAGRVVVLAALCAAVSILFCLALHQSGVLYTRWLKNPYVRAAVGGALVLVLMLLFGRDYMGAGMDVIERSMQGHVFAGAFLLKLLFTAVTLGAGYKGGEIVPSFFVGAAFGCAAAAVLGLNPSFGAAIGLVSVFCGVTNCPITSFVLSLELFGAQGMPFFLLAAAVSYRLSGYYGLYRGQKILYSKNKPVFINQNAG